MHGRMTRVKMSPDRLADAVSDFEKTIAGPIRSQPGFQGISLLVNRQTGESISVSYWADEKALAASAQFLDRARADVTGRAGAQIVSVETAEILDVERTGSPQANTFVRLNTVSGTPDKIDRAISMYKSQVVPALKQQAGFRAAIAAANRQTGKIVVSSIWATAAEREASDAALSQLRRDTGEVAGNVDVKVELFEVALVDIPVTAATN